MALITTHLQFCEHVIDQTDANLQTKQNMTYLLIGSQGENLLAFYPIWNPGKYNVSDSHTHDVATDTEENLKELITSVPPGSENILYYLIGYFTYCFLETNLSRYVHYYKEQTQLNGYQVKLLIDQLMMKQHFNLEPSLIPVHKEFMQLRKLDDEITPFLQLINPHLAKHLTKAYKHAKIMLAWQYDPDGIKAKLLPKYEALYTEAHATYRIDFLNENKVVWDPSTQDNRSFFEIYHETSAKSAAFINQVLRYWRTEDDSYLTDALNLLKEFNLEINKA